MKESQAEVGFQYRGFETRGMLRVRIPRTVPSRACTAPLSEKRGGTRRG
jgi:hypothetical protein